MKKEQIHLIGIGGTGMTALAGLLQQAGYTVSGSDKKLYPPTSEILAELGLQVSEGFSAANLHPAPDLVVIGNAVSRGNPEVEEVLDRKLRYTSMPRLISERFLEGRHSIVVAGTHGKTTTASMVAWLLESAGRAPGYLIGGRPLNFERPFDLGQGQPFVIEGDEYDTAFFDKGPKFMHYRPDTVLLGTVEMDHADIYRDLSEVKRVFSRLVNLIPGRGLLVRNADCEVTSEVSAGAFCREAGYGVGAGSWRAAEICHDEERTRFKLMHDGRLFTEIELATGGEHNVLNSISAAAAVHDLGLTAAEISAGLASFKGVSRRLEIRGEAQGVLVLDDFAHHPTAVEATVGAVRKRYPGRRILAILEPRSWSLRRNIFQQRLSEVFDSADEVIIAEVFNAEAIPANERLDTQKLVADLRARGGSASFIPDTQAIVERIAETGAEGDLLLVMSNGGFEGLPARLLTALESRALTRGC